MENYSGMGEINLVLTGRIGNGKSAAGNSILGKKVFKTDSSKKEVRSTELLKRTCHTYGQAVTVVDGLDIDDDDSSFKERAEKVLKMLTEGITAFVFVLKYGIRFTRQEKEAVSLMRSTFGQNVLQKHGIIVMSHGDNFYQNSEESLNFSDFCEKQTGDIQNLFKECGWRIVLFDKYANPEGMKEQYEQLMSQVRQIKLNSGPYTQSDFKSWCNRQKSDHGVDKQKPPDEKTSLTQQTGNRKWWFDGKLFTLYSVGLLAVSCGVTAAIYYLVSNDYFSEE